ncbi:helix-turn-helix domain-containing protein [Burkholderia sp. BCC0397]|uniref:helix-turn-helix domain-containing protein n=1 Tax=Burkholderia sp. BCC0397 TaxID=486876 RepID=UPI00158E078F|nr:helix-turn-helix domain-containing protein [Burkholderia sp. BCC0397]
MSDTSKFDHLVRRLRARVERSASREQSLDWKAANAIDHLQAECARLVAETRSLRREMGEVERHAAAAPAQPPMDAGVPESLAASTAPALGLQEAADLLNVSYSTVFANRRALGFFQVGRQWRIWPETLREEMERRTKKPSSKPPGIDPSLPPDWIPPLRPQTLSPSARQAEKELDALLKSLKPAAKRRQNAARLPDPIPSARQAEIRAEYEKLIGLPPKKSRKKT